MQSSSCLPLISSAIRVLRIAQATQISTMSAFGKAKAFFRIELQIAQIKEGDFSEAAQLSDYICKIKITSQYILV